jgi:hypothetical protein
MKKGRAATMTHDYKRHGTTTELSPNLGDGLIVQAAALG